MKFPCVFLILSFVLSLNTAAFAQGEGIKHPRVIELESVLSSDAADFLRNRVPNRPVMLTVTVEANRKVEAERGGGDSNLPYFDQFEEEVL
ncbi:MAG: hypothetical protein K2X47_04755, partial [Bdellovibrionales bacterium]|nr:hypothetical protein [Bdellovibrionales bacterium]